MTRTILVATDDGRDPSYAAARAGVEAWAAGSGDRIILYDRSAESYFVDPYASGTWTADVESGPGPDGPLTPDDLRPLGRAYLAEQVEAARARGLDVFAWLPTQTGANGMSEAVDRFGADLVVLPTSMGEPGLLDRVRGNTLERFREALSVPVATADASGVQEVGVSAS